MRMRVWRALKAAGGGLLRDGVYVLPNSASARRVFQEEGAEIREGGGLVHILTFDADSEEQNATLAALFDRTTEYREAVSSLEALKREIPRVREAEARQRLSAVSREVSAILARDFFPGKSRGQIEGASMQERGPVVLCGDFCASQDSAPRPQGFPCSHLGHARAPLG